MKNLVEFIMVGNNIAINSYGDYLEEKLELLASEGVISSDYSFQELEISEKVSVENNFLWGAEVSVEEIAFQIVFSFETYNNTTQLSVSINSDLDIESMILNSAQITQKSVLEFLKVKLKNKLFNFNREQRTRDWRQCVWIYDIESEAYAVKLYPLIYRLENLCRQFINEVMCKSYGASWWDKIASLDLKNKRSARSTSFISIAPALNDVDESLLSIDSDDLLKIFKSTIYEWEVKPDDKVITFINTYRDRGIDHKDIDAIRAYLFSPLKEQLDSGTKIDLWEETFSKYLPTSFEHTFKIFVKNRNHIAHNKLVDFQAYSSIFNNINDLKNEITKALSLFNDNTISEENKDLFEKERQIEMHEQEEAEIERMESEAGVRIRSESEIFDLFNEILFSIHEEIAHELRFRMDIELSEFTSISEIYSEQKVFSAKYKIDDSKLDIYCKCEINDEQGTESVLELILKLNDVKINCAITYTNGEVSFNHDQGYYMPETQDEINEDEKNEAVSEIISLINDSFENLKEKVDDAAYSIIKDGGASPVADIPCCECGQEYICVDENYGEFGRCLNCGEMNYIDICSRCSCYFETWGVSNNEDEPKFCDNCLEYFENE